VWVASLLNASTISRAARMAASSAPSWSVGHSRPKLVLLQHFVIRARAALRTLLARSYSTLSSMTRFVSQRVTSRPSLDATLPVPPHVLHAARAASVQSGQSISAASRSTRW